MSNEKEPLIDPDELAGNVDEINELNTETGTLASPIYMQGIGNGLEDNITTSAFIRGMQDTLSRTRKIYGSIIFICIVIIGVMAYTIHLKNTEIDSLHNDFISKTPIDNSFEEKIPDYNNFEEKIPDYNNFDLTPKIAPNNRTSNTIEQDNIVVKDSPTTITTETLLYNEWIKYKKYYYCYSKNKITTNTFTKQIIDMDILAKDTYLDINNETYFYFTPNEYVNSDTFQGIKTKIEEEIKEYQKYEKETKIIVYKINNVSFCNRTMKRFVKYTNKELREEKTDLEDRGSTPSQFLNIKNPSKSAHGINKTISFLKDLIFIRNYETRYPDKKINWESRIDWDKILEREY